MSFFQSFFQLLHRSWTRWIGFRYLRSKKSSSFLSFITLLSVGGVALGVAATVIVLSVMDGFEEKLRKRLTSTRLHILVTPTLKTPGVDEGMVRGSGLTSQLKKLESKPEVVSVNPVIATEAILRAGRVVYGVELKGLQKDYLQVIEKTLIEKAKPQMLVQKQGAETIRFPGLYIGRELAYDVGLVPGDILTLISPLETMGPFGAIPRLKRFVVEGIYQSEEIDHEMGTVYASASGVQSFLRRRGVVSQWEIELTDFEKAPAIAETIRKEVSSGLRVRDWIQLNSSLFASLRLERVAMFIAMLFIVIVASFNIVTTLTLMVLEKKKEVSILSAMGATRSQVGAIFLAEGIFIGAVGIAIGLATAFVLSHLLKTYEFIQLPDVYYDRTLPVSFQPHYYLIIGAAAMVIVLFACVYPSLRAARMHPIEGIRS